MRSCSYQSEGHHISNLACRLSEEISGSDENPVCPLSDARRRHACLPICAPKLDMKEKAISPTLSLCNPCTFRCSPQYRMSHGARDRIQHTLPSFTNRGQRHRMLDFCSCKPGKASFCSNLRPKRSLSCLRPEYQQSRAQSLISTSKGSSFRIRPPVTAVYSPEQGTFGQPREYQRAPQSPAPLQQRSARQYQQSDLQQDPGRPSRQYWPDSQPSTSQSAPTYPDRTPQIDPRSRSYGQQRPMQPAFVRRVGFHADTLFRTRCSKVVKMSSREASHELACKTFQESFSDA